MGIDFKRLRAQVHAKDQNAFNKIIDETIKAGVDERFGEYVEGVREIAHLWKGAGYPRQGFLDLMEHVETQIELRCDNPLIRQRLRVEMKVREEKRLNGRIIVGA